MGRDALIAGEAAGEKRDSDLNDVMSDSFHFPLRVCVCVCLALFPPSANRVEIKSFTHTFCPKQHLSVPTPPSSQTSCQQTLLRCIHPSPLFPPNPSGHHPPSCCQQDLAPDGTGICPGNQIQGVSGALSLCLPLFSFLSHRSTTEMQPRRQYRLGKNAATFQKLFFFFFFPF